MADFVPPPKNSASPFADMRGHHVAVRVPSLAEAKDFYVEKLDFRVIAEWDYADEKLAYLAPPTDDHFYIEVLGDGDTPPEEVRPYTDLGDSLKYRGYHHFCLNVKSVNETLATLRSRASRATPTLRSGTTTSSRRRFGTFTTSRQSRLSGRLPRNSWLASSSIGTER